MAFYSLKFKAAEIILTSMAEYASNYIAYLQITRPTGAQVEVIPNDEFGQVSISALEEMVTSRVKLIAITHVPTNGVLVNPATEIGKIAREAGVIYLLEGCQSVGQLPIDVKEIGCDMLSATGRKYLRGPRGTGLIFVKKDLIEQLEPPFLDLHAATWTEKNKYVIKPNARRFENWETNVAGKIGFGAAIDYALPWRIEAIWQRVLKLAILLRSQLKTIPGVTIQDLGQVQCGIVSFTVEGLEADEIKNKLPDTKINVTVSRTSSTLLDMESRKLNSVVRDSLHYYNSEEEIERFIKEIELMVK